MIPTQAPNATEEKALTARILCVIAIALSATACAAFRTLIGLGPLRPKVQVTDIQIEKANLMALDLIVSVRVDNPNDFALDLSNLHYQLQAAGLSVASGNYAPRIVIAEKASQTIRLPLSIDPAAALKLAQQLIGGTDDVTAVTTAVADFVTPFGPMTVDFDDARPLRKLAGF